MLNPSGAFSPTRFLAITGGVYSAEVATNETSAASPSGRTREPDAGTNGLRNTVRATEILVCQPM
jgi:hypothetical protein